MSRQVFTFKDVRLFSEAVNCRIAEIREAQTEVKRSVNRLPGVFRDYEKHKDIHALKEQYIADTELEITELQILRNTFAAIQDKPFGLK